MKLGYTIWNDYHFAYHLEILDQLRDIGVEVIVIAPQYLLDRDDRARLGAVYHPIRSVVEAARMRSFEIMLKPHFTPRDSRGKLPADWQGWVGTVDMNSWPLLMGRIKLEVESLARDYRPQYLCIGSDLAGTHNHRTEWQETIDTVTLSSASLVYGSSSWEPLLKRFRWALFWSILFGRYQRILDLTLPSKRFVIPGDQGNRVGQSIYRSGFRFDLDAVGLNLYWPPEDPKHEDLRTAWFDYALNGFEINYVEAVEQWHRTNPLWITECDLIGPHRADLEYYRQWWETCLEVWENRCEMLICREDGEPQWIKLMQERKQVG